MNEIPISIVGRLADDPELRQRSDGVAVAHFDVVVTERHEVDGQWRTRCTTSLACTAWRALAEHVYASLFRGDRVVLLGRLRQRPALDDDKAPYRYDVMVDDVGASLRFTNVWSIAAVPKQGESTKVLPCGVLVSKPSQHRP